MINAWNKTNKLMVECVRDLMAEELLQLLLEPYPPIAEEEDPATVIRVLPEGTLFVTIGERDTIEIDLPVGMPKKAYVRVYVKGGKATFSEAIIQDFR